MLKCYYADIELLQEQIAYERQLIQLEEERQRKVSYLKNIEDKKRAVLAGTLVNYAISQDGYHSCDVEFLKTPEGKPYLKDKKNFSDDEYVRKYSMSHSGAYACVILSDREVGIDVEHLSRSFLKDGKEDRLESVAKKCFAPAEWKRFQNTSIEDRKCLFLEYWTRKESYSKAIGLGMKMDFSMIDTETDAEKYFSTWTEDGYCISIYVEDGNYDDFEMEKVMRL